MGNDFATLTNTWEGWNYYSDGTVIGPDGTYYSGGQAVWSPDPTPSPADAGLGGGFSFGSTLDYVMRTAADTYKSRTLIQANQQGQRYIEGRPGIYGPAGYQQANGGGLTMLLLIGGLVLLVAKG